MADFNEAIRLDPNLSRAFSNRGDVYSGKGDNDRAIADFDEAIRLDPKNAMALYKRGLIYTKEGDSHRAIVDLSEAIRLDPKLDPRNDIDTAYAYVVGFAEFVAAYPFKIVSLAFIVAVVLVVWLAGFPFKIVSLAFIAVLVPLLVWFAWGIRVFHLVMAPERKARRLLMR
ncbi:MAG: tetratricopeptide repeat protein [Bradyrhizobium sp.]